MARFSGDGEVTGALDITSIACELFSEIIKGIGAKSGLIGICGGRTTTTGDHAGAGADSDASAGTCIVNEFFTGGLVLSG